jgi:cytochrome c oxidase assembly protein subunit 15
MPFDTTDFPALPGRRAASLPARRLVAAWLFAVCAMVWGMVVLGGMTRLTGSGLSIMEWAPLSGILPPLGRDGWEKLFALYRTIPQYHLLHEGMGLDGFQRLFWLEWMHRLWGRLIGFVVFVPLVWLALTRRIDRRLIPRLLTIFVLGGVQGAVGWFMVASGFLPDTTSVAPSRLVIHLALALALYVAILWTGLGVLRPVPSRPFAGSQLLRGLALAATGALGLAILAGGFVAGTHAGLEYNTFPLMEGRLVPANYARVDPIWRNLTQNIAAVQFDHRLLATLAAVLSCTVVAAALARPVPRPVCTGALALGLAVLAQYALGVATLLWVVPLPLAAAHQANAVLALTAAVVVLHRLRPARSR